jgi:hypothetical protein
MLMQAWRSPAILGLQAWNENTRRSSTVGSPGSGVVEIGWERNEGIASPKPVNVARSGFLSSAGAFELKPWNLTNGRWQRLATGVESQLKHGTFTWDTMNHWGLDPNRTAQLPWLEPGEPRRVFFAGGSDAHGDLNVRREGYFMGTESITDTAIGSPRNLVYVAEGGTPVVDPLPNDQQATVYPHDAIVTALASGRFTVTDGPALRIVVDLDGDGVIDDTDPPMGSVVDLGSSPTLPLLVDWKSTPEFGAVASIDLYVGVHRDGEGRTYAPYYHGTGRYDGLPLPAGAYTDDQGRLHESLNDDYWHVTETADTRLRIAGGPPGPGIPFCEVHYRVCGLTGDGPVIGSSSTGGPITAPALDDCAFNTEIEPCSVCSEPVEDPDITILSCDTAGSWPGEEPPLPADQWEGLEAVTLDLTAFQVDEDLGGDRFFVRALARTHERKKGVGPCDTSAGDCITRYALTNPVWVLSEAAAPPPPSGPMCHIRERVCTETDDEGESQATGGSPVGNRSTALGPVTGAAGALPDGCRIVDYDAPCEICQPWQGAGELDSCEEIP